MRQRWRDRSSFPIKFSFVMGKRQLWKMLSVGKLVWRKKSSRKAEVKGGIHGRLEKAKAEIKAKEGDKVPKNKSKELATAL